MVKNLSIIIPARNEEENIKNIIPAIYQNYGNRILEILLIDDNSTDSTSRVADQMAKKFPSLKVIRRSSKPGVGLSLREGIRNLSPKSAFVLFMDCDFLANVPDIVRMLTVIEGFDGIAGSRFLTGTSLVNYSFIKKIANRSYHLLAKLLFNLPHQDLTNNFKLYRKKLVDKIFPFLTSKDFAINAEIGFYPVLFGARIKEIPVSWSERTIHMGLSKFKIFKVGPSYGKVMLRLIRMKYFTGPNNEYYGKEKSFAMYQQEN